MLEMIRAGAGHINAWQAYACELAIWAWERLVNRIDVWGGYNAIANRDKIIQRPDGTMTKLGATTTRPAVAKRGRVLLRLSTLEQHFRATRPEHVIGLHTTSPASTSKWASIELDVHGDQGNKPEDTLRAALAWFGRLRGIGFDPLLWDSNGKGGYHLDILLREPIPTPKFFSFLHWLASDYETLGLSARPEVFPKQLRIAPCKFGNWLRVIGRHHTRDHWAKVWDGAAWLEGSAAVQFVLSLHGDNPALIPASAPFARRDWPAVPSPAAPLGTRSDRPAVAAAPSPLVPRNDDQLSRRIASYLARLPNLSEGQGRDNVAFRFAAWLVHDLQLDDVQALPWLNLWDAANHPPKGAARLEEIVRNARKYGRHTYGSGLSPAGDPVRRRRRGHHLNQIRFRVEV
jgi:hypothetical protein